MRTTVAPQAWIGKLAEIAEAPFFEPDDLECLVDEDEEAETFLHGRCHLMAIALHEATGLPIGAFVDDDGEGRSWLLHAFVMDGEDIVDVRGRRSVASMLSDFDVRSTVLDPSSPVAMTVDEVVRWGEGKTKIGKDGQAALGQARLAAAHIAAIAALPEPPNAPSV